MTLTWPAGCGQAPSGDVVIIVYTGSRESLATYRAPSGRQYRFAATPPYHRKPVALGDAAYFIALGDFAREGG